MLAYSQGLSEIYIEKEGEKERDTRYGFTEYGTVNLGAMFTWLALVRQMFPGD